MVFAVLEREQSVQTNCALRSPLKVCSEPLGVIIILLALLV